MERVALSLGVMVVSFNDEKRLVMVLTANLKIKNPDRDDPGFMCFVYTASDGMPRGHFSLSRREVLVVRWVRGIISGRSCRPSGLVGFFFEVEGQFRSVLL